jgi:ABC-2 type transport system ATP-binding protein
MTTQAVQALDVQGLERSYGELRVLRGVDFEVARGSIFALLGPNGAGKTTVIRILSTLLKADAGTASVNGFDVATHPAKARATRSSPAGRTWCWWPGCGACRTPARSPRTCSIVSS